MPAAEPAGTEVHLMALSQQSRIRERLPQIDGNLSQLKAAGFIDRVFANEEIAGSR